MRRLWSRHAVAVIAAAWALVATPSAALAAATTTWSTPTIVDHAFARPFTLDHGALSVIVFHGVTPPLPRGLATTMWSTSTLYGQVRGLGWGVVTVDPGRTRNTESPRVTPLVDVPAFVGLVRGDNRTRQCTAMVTRGSTVVPVSDGWQAVIFPLDVHRSVAVFEASSNICGRIHPDAIASATEVLSVRWHLAASTRQVVISLPRCATFDSWGGAGRPAGSIIAAVHLLERPLDATCAPATNVDVGGDYASPTTLHGATGPLLQVGPGGVMTN